jgi:SAM-dependent methyltransferase
MTIDEPSPAQPPKLSARRRIERAINRGLGRFGIKLVRQGRTQTIGGRRMSEAQLLRAARARGLSPGACLEELFGRPGRAEEIVAWMHAAGALDPRLATVCEIGPGSGLYIQLVRARLQPMRYEIYEIAPQRAAYLERRYPVIAQPTDGETLTATETGSIDLVHAHGVFVTTPFLTNCAYFEEIARVTAPGGWVCFDIVTKDCLDPDTLEAWIESPLRYLSLHSRAHIDRFFERHGFELVDTMEMPLLVQGRARYFVFRKSA